MTQKLLHKVFICMIVTDVRIRDWQGMVSLLIFPFKRKQKNSYSVQLLGLKISITDNLCNYASAIQKVNLTNRQHAVNVLGHKDKDGGLLLCPVSLHCVNNL